LEFKNVKYERTAVKPEQYPSGHLPEIAFVGRSNIGKSSIINSLVNKKNLARVGATPGKTRVINFYNIDNRFYFVDLPGYGYAKVSKSEKESWDKMIETYLFSRTELRLMIMLVDIRHTPTEQDQMMYEWIINRSTPVVVVATKADKIPRSQLDSRLLEIKTTLNMQGEIIPIIFSTLTKQGIDELWRQILAQINKPVKENFTNQIKEI
jgi:GTP-binding protein